MPPVERRRPSPPFNSETGHIRKMSIPGDKYTAVLYRERRNPDIRLWNGAAKRPEFGAYATVRPQRVPVRQQYVKSLYEALYSGEILRHARRVSCAIVQLRQHHKRDYHGSCARDALSQSRLALQESYDDVCVKEIVTIHQRLSPGNSAGHPRFRASPREGRAP